MSIVKIGGRTFPIGSTITFNGKAHNCIPGVKAGLKVLVHRVIDGGKTIGLYSDKERLQGWGNLDDEVSNGRGWWVSATELSTCIMETDDQEFEIKKSLLRRGVELKGKSCRLLTHFSDGKNVFVEFDEHVNGCSADGMGKSGHCVALNSNILTKKKREKHAK